MTKQLNTRVADDIADSIRELARMSAIPIGTLVEAMLAARLGVSHPYEKAVYLATQRWKGTRT